MKMYDDFEVDEILNIAHFEIVSTLGCKNNDIVQEDGLQYTHRICCTSFQEKIPTFRERTCNTAKTNWVKIVAKGHLMYPSFQLNFFI